LPKKLTEKEVIDWLQKNAPHIQIIEWTGKATSKSKFIDRNRNIVGKVEFRQLKSSLKKDPTFLLNPSKEEMVNKYKQTCLEKYGVENPSQLKEVKQKRKQTCLKKYGAEHPLQNKNVLNKLQKTNIKKYGNVCSAQNDEVKNKIKNTCLERYEAEHFFQSEEVKEKIKQTNFERYGVENPSQNIEIKNKQKQTNLKKYGFTQFSKTKKYKEKVKQTNIEKYGVEHSSQNKEIKEKIKQTRIEKGLTKLYDGKTIKEWAQDPNIASVMTIRRVIWSGGLPKETRVNCSSLEIIVKHFLKKQNINFIHDKILPEHKGMRKGFKRPDFLLPDYNLIIECDGEYYHLDKEKDKIRNKTYKDIGYKVLCFSGNEIENKFDYVKYKIINKLKILKYFKNICIQNI